MVMFIAPPDVGWRNRRPVMEFRTPAEPECRGFRVLGEVEAFSKRRMIIELVTKVFDEPIMHCHEEIIGTGGAVLLLWVKPARRNVSVAGQWELSLTPDRTTR